MKNLFLVMILSWGLSAWSQSLWIGEWKLQEMIYHGERIPLPNPDLNLRFTFYQNGNDRLYWDRGTDEFCERWARYSIRSGILHQEAFAVNPGNAPECQKDPDMQIGGATQTKVLFDHQEMQLFFPMGEEELVYVLRLQNP